MPVSDAAVAPQRPELLEGVASGPLSEGEIRATVAVASEVAHDQDALKPDDVERTFLQSRSFFLLLNR